MPLSSTVHSVSQSFSHTVHDLMVGLMSCSLHVEGHGIMLMNHEKGRHTSLCERFNSQLVVIHTVHPPKAAPSISTDTECFIKTTYSAMAWKPVDTDYLLTARLHLVTVCVPP